MLSAPVASISSSACSPVLTRLLSYRLTGSSPSVIPISRARPASLLSTATLLARPAALAALSYLRSAE